MNEHERRTKKSLALKMVTGKSTSRKYLPLLSDLMQAEQMGEKVFDTMVHEADESGYLTPAEFKKMPGATQYQVTISVLAKLNKTQSK